MWKNLRKRHDQLAILQNRRKLLDQLINLKISRPADLIRKVIFRKTFEKKILSKLVTFTGIVITHDRSIDEITVEIKPYLGQNETAGIIRKTIGNKYQDLIFDILVHGSIATHEECSYSDFDGLVILNDRALALTDQLRGISSELSRLRKWFLKTDILQHHGWFLLTESDLLNLDTAYFPVEILRHSKSLLKHSAYSIRLIPDSDPDFSKTFSDVSNKTLRLTESVVKQMDMYELKSVLSRIFLLPALYHQAKYSKGIFKKDSFDTVKQEFGNQLWQPIDDASRIRSQWSQKVSKIRSFLIMETFSLPLSLRKIFYPAAGKRLREQICSLLPGLKLLISEMHKRLEQP